MKAPSSPHPVYNVGTPLTNFRDVAAMVKKYIPDAVIARLAGATDQAREGRRLCIELIREIRSIRGVRGVHVMAYRQEESVAEVIAESGVLDGRVPWYPGRDAEKQSQSQEALS